MRTCHIAIIACNINFCWKTRNVRPRLLPNHAPHNRLFQGMGQKGYSHSIDIRNIQPVCPRQGEKRKLFLKKFFLLGKKRTWRKLEGTEEISAFPSDRSMIFSLACLPQFFVVFYLSSFPTPQDGASNAIDYPYTNIWLVGSVKEPNSSATTLSPALVQRY